MNKNTPNQLQCLLSNLRCMILSCTSFFWSQKTVISRHYCMLITYSTLAQPEWKLKNQCHVNISSCMMRWCAGLHRTNAKKHNREIQDFFSAPINTNLAIFSSKVRSTVGTYIPHTLDAFAVCTVNLHPIFVKQKSTLLKDMRGNYPFTWFKAWKSPREEPKISDVKGKKCWLFTSFFLRFKSSELDN